MYIYSRNPDCTTGVLRSVQNSQFFHHKSCEICDCQNRMALICDGKFISGHWAVLGRLYYARGASWLSTVEHEKLQSSSLYIVCPPGHWVSIDCDRQFMSRQYVCIVYSHCIHASTYSFMYIFQGYHVFKMPPAGLRSVINTYSHYPNNNYCVTLGWKVTRLLVGPT